MTNILSSKNLLTSEKRKFTIQEDEMISNLVEKYGKKWSIIASQMKTRNGRQIRERYVNYLESNIIHGNWTAEEDDKLLTLCSQRETIS
jgi:hypothetical protein